MSWLENTNRFSTFFLLFIYSLVCSAITTTWTGTSGPAWETESNWNNGLPSSEDTVIIDNTGIPCFLSTNQVIYSLIIADTSELISNANLDIQDKLEIGNEGSFSNIGALNVYGKTYLNSFSQLNIRGTVAISAVFHDNVNLLNKSGSISTQGSNIIIEFKSDFIDFSNATFQFGNSSCTYSGAQSQKIAPSTYKSLILRGSGEKVLESSSLVIMDSLDLGACEFRIVDGLLRTQQETVIEVGNSTINYASENLNQVIEDLGKPYYNLEINGPEPKLNSSMNSHLKVINNLIINSPLVLGNDSLTVGGNIEVKNTLSQENNVLFLVGDSSTTINGNTELTVQKIVLNKNQNAPVYIDSKVNISPGGQLTLLNKKDTLYITDTLSFLADETGYSTVDIIPDSSLIVGTIMSEFYINANARAWHPLGSPLSRVALDDLLDDLIITGDFLGNRNSELSGTTESSLLEFDTSNSQINWTNYPIVTSTEKLNSTLGYRIFIQDDLLSASPKNVEISGELNQGNISIPLIYKNNNTSLEGWNLIPNPYLANLDWDKIDQSNLFYDTGYLWNPTTRQFELLQSGSIIPPFKSFFVKSNGNSESLILKEQTKATDRQNATETVRANTILLGLEENNADRIFNFATSKIVLDETSFDSAEKQKDQGYVSRNTFSGYNQKQLVDIGSLSSDNIILKVNSVSSANQQIEIFTEFSDYGDYNLSISLQNFNILGIISLYDSFLDTTVFLNSRNEINYNFQTNNNATSKANTRFKLNIDLEPVGNQLPDEAGHLNIYPNPASEGFYLSSNTKAEKIKVINSTGQTMLTHFTNQNNKSYISIKDLSNGVYTIIFISSNGLSQEQLLIKE